jgi:hypothetical protein
MRILTGLALATVIALGFSTESRSQAGYARVAPSAPMIYPTTPVAGVTPAGAYAFKDEPVMSINNSYLGYSNFVDPSHPAPRYIFNQGAVRPPVSYAPIPQRRGTGWFGWRHRNR